MTKTTKAINWKKLTDEEILQMRVRDLKLQIQDSSTEPLIKKLYEEPTSKGSPPWSASRMTSPLAAFYDRKRKALGSSFQGYYDDSLKELFKTGISATTATKASAALRLYRRQIADNVARWTGHRKYDIYQLVGRIITRCDVLDLYLKAGQTEDIIAVTALVTAIAGNTFIVRARQKR